MGAHSIYTVPLVKTGSIANAYSLKVRTRPLDGDYYFSEFACYLGIIQMVELVDFNYQPFYQGFIRSTFHNIFTYILSLSPINQYLSTACFSSFSEKSC